MVVLVFVSPLVSTSVQFIAPYPKFMLAIFNTSPERSKVTTTTTTKQKTQNPGEEDDPVTALL